LAGLAFSIAALCDSAGGIQWTAPANWKPQPQRPMRAATYIVPAAAGDKEDGECGVFYFGPGQGGSVEDNIKRWVGQFQPGANAPKKANSTAGAGLKMTTVEHSGTFMAGGPMTQERTPKPGYRLIGAIVEAPGGNVFFKLTGPEKTVAAAKPAFDKMLQSVKK
jgi:hypothetical protein